jgi:putative DNA primase/helicase
MIEGEAAADFHLAMRERGLVVPTGGALADGKLHRCDVNGLHGRGDGAYLLFGDGVPAGGLQNWQDGGGWQSWRADLGRALTPTEDRTFRERLEAARRERETEAARRHEEAVRLAHVVWQEAGSADGHPYLARKSIAHSGARQISARRVRELGAALELNGPLLVVPVQGPDGSLRGLQFIAADGAKRFLTGTAKSGAYFVIGRPHGDVLAVAEGFATGASVHAATGWPVAIAFDAGNLRPVAETLRSKGPASRIVIAGDNDANGVGQRAASEAANAVGGVVILPPDTGQDWNDRVAAVAVESVRAELASPITPRLAITSAEKRCGKSTLLRAMSALVSKPLAASNITAAAIFRTVEACQPTLLIDEADTFLPENEELRGILNSGHARDGAVIRLVGDDHEPRQFSTWAPSAVAAIGELPGTIADRSVIIRMERQRPTDRKVPLRLDKLDALKSLARRVARWAADNRTALAEADPDVPAGLHDRAADNWRPLLAIADAAGGRWPEAARYAALALSGGGDAPSSNREKLLGDIRAVFVARGVDRLSSADLCGALAGMEDRPWPEWRQGKPITPRQIASLLAPLAVSPGTIRLGSDTAKGYLLDQFADAFARYLPEEAPLDPSHRHNPQEIAKISTFGSVTTDPAVTDRIAEKPRNSAACDGVTDREGETGPGNEWESF